MKLNGVGMLKRKETNILSLWLREIILTYKKEWKEKYLGKGFVEEHLEIIIVFPYI